jgi:hypothetical protein
MRTARFLAAILAPVAIVACAVGTAPVEGGGGVADGGVGPAADSSYGTTGEGGPVQGGDSGSAGKDSGSSTKDSGGGGVIDSGGGGGSGDDCIGDTDSSGTSYNTDCNIAEFFGDDEPCTPGGSDCASAGECCYSNMAKSCIASFGPQCEVP